ncbi:hypothetical protein [Pandoraea terrigena]|uniref:Uncharacterized protein n=1 Tax=Pandoraea terrigena TaxID=2508292 RepID=A0A5E4V835_9BURK|nr:hypothetical protein [Pandoraea terrigena]VVE07020.1 hypothetical protein PTE31013_02442 [Pandoraea terrigena]
MEDEHLEVIANLINQFGMKLQVHSFALEALASTHPNPKAVAESFRLSVDAFLAEHDDVPIPGNGRDVLLLETNAFLEALGQMGRDESRG